MVVEQKLYQQPTVNGLLKRLINDVNSLAMKHIELFRYEIKEEAQTAAKYTSIALAGTLMAFTSLIFFGFFLIFTLSLFLPLWLSSLVVTLLYIILAIIAVVIAKDHIQRIKPVPESRNETETTMKEANRWLHEKR